MSLFNQFTSSETRDIVRYAVSHSTSQPSKMVSCRSKILLSLVCYVFQDGPWRDTLVRLGFDPRKEVAARL